MRKALVIGFLAALSAPKTFAAVPALPQDIGALSAVLRCKVSDVGLISNCDVTAENPNGKGLGVTAQRALNGQSTAPGVSSGRPAAGMATIPVCFNSTGNHIAISTAGSACSVPMATYTSGDLIQRPTPQAMKAVYPARALEVGLAGRAALSCHVSSEGFIHDCTVVSESPSDEGFGRAAVSLLQSIKVKPKLIDGFPRAGTLEVPVIFFPG